MQSNSKTPRTDAAVCLAPEYATPEYVHGDFARGLEREIAKLKEERELNTQEIDSYGEPGSNFRICAYCKSESGAGFLDKGISHESGCILATA